MATKKSKKDVETSLKQKNIIDKVQKLLKKEKLVDLKLKLNSIHLAYDDDDRPCLHWETEAVHTTDSHGNPVVILQPVCTQWSDPE